jgi:hypothetical protein
MEHWWNYIDREHPKYSEKKPLPQYTLSTANNKWKNLESNSNLRGERLETNRLIHRTDGKDQS